jgi:hypothetical protein
MFFVIAMIPVVYGILICIRQEPLQKEFPDDKLRAMMETLSVALLRASNREETERKSTGFSLIIPRNDIPKRGGVLSSIADELKALVESTEQELESLELVKTGIRAASSLDASDADDRQQHPSRGGAPMIGLRDASRRDAQLLRRQRTVKPFSRNVQNLYKSKTGGDDDEQKIFDYGSFFFKSPSASPAYKELVSGHGVHHQSSSIMLLGVDYADIAAVSQLLVLNDGSDLHAVVVDDDDDDDREINSASISPVLNLAECVERLHSLLLLALNERDHQHSDSSSSGAESIVDTAAAAPSRKFMRLYRRSTAVSRELHRFDATLLLTGNNNGGRSGGMLALKLSNALCVHAALELRKTIHYVAEHFAQSAAYRVGSRVVTYQQLSAVDFMK